MRPRRQSHVSHDRWLISYADFITLLFAFFVVMYAVAQNDRAKARELSDSVRRAMQEGGIPSAFRSMMAKEAVQARAVRPPQPKPEPSHNPKDLEPSLSYLKVQLKEEISSGKLQVSMDRRGIIISLRERSFFPSGENTIYPAAYESMGKIAGIMADLPNPVRLEGHTDSVPIHNGRFHNNWELSAARSIAVLEFFDQRYHIPTERFAVAGYADNLPVADNGSEEGRSRNRRVDIVILNRSGLAEEARPAGATNVQ